MHLHGPCHQAMLVLMRAVAGRIPVPWFFPPLPPPIELSAGLLEDLLHDFLQLVFATSRNRRFDLGLRGIDSGLKVLAPCGDSQKRHDTVVATSYHRLICS